MKKTICLFFLIGILLSWNVWTSTRFFPINPVFSFLENTFFLNHVTLFSCIILLGIQIIYDDKRLLWGTFLSVIFLILQDQARLQPWVYMYLLLLVPFLFSFTEKASLDYCKILIIAIYIWSGIHKFNPLFKEFIVESFAVDLFNSTNPNLIFTFKKLAYAIAAIEIFVGFLLIFKKTRNFGVFLSIAMHLYVLMYLSPFSLPGNTVVYPWNIFMLISISYLFYKNPDKIRISKSIPLNLLLIAILLTPIGNFYGKWDTAISFSMYSGKFKNLYVLIPDEKIAQNDFSNFEEYYTDIEGMSGGKIIDMNKWSYRTMNVPYYSEKRFLIAIHHFFSKQNIIAKDFVFIETELPLWNRNLFETYKIQKSETAYLKELFFLNFEKPICLKNYKEINP